MWSLGILIGLPIAALLILVVLSLTVAATISPEFDNGWSWGIGLAVIAVILAVTGFATWPWSSEYHRWATVSGTVAQVNSRLVGDSSSAHQKFVVRLTDGRVRGVDDTRGALLKPGDRVKLKCKRSYQWAASPGWDCNWDSSVGQ